jgi:SOS response regulatory protein OraA/RecX
MKSWESFEEERAGARKKALVLLTDMDRSESELSEKLKRIMQNRIDKSLNRMI